MLNSQRIPFFNSTKLWLIVLMLLAIPLIGEFNARLIVSRQLFEEETQLRQEIELEHERNEFLQSYQTYMNSDAAVEWWARVQARMVQPGEIAVVPQMPSAQENPNSSPDTLIQEHDPPSEWWAAFFATIP